MARGRSCANGKGPDGAVERTVTVDAHTFVVMVAMILVAFEAATG